MDMDFIAINGIIGALLPILMSTLKQQSWTTQVKRYVSMGLAIVASVVATGASQGWASFDWQSLVASASVIITLSQSTYSGFWKDSKVDATLTEKFQVGA